MDQRTWAVIDLDKLRQNIQVLRKTISTTCPTPKILAVVKADAYGHGAVEVSQVLKEEKIDMLGVASIDEAYELKDIGLPIVILSPVSESDIPSIVKENFIPTVTYLSFANKLDREARHQNKQVKLHIEIDTGMTRTGVNWKVGVRFVEKVTALKNIKVQGLFTHFSEPENKESDFTNLQIDRFNSVIKELQRKRIFIPLLHTASTGAILNFPNSHFNMVRPGIMLYGMDASNSKNNNKKIKINPILSLYTRVCQLNTSSKGTRISYGTSYITKKAQKIATLWVGYGDGYFRSLSNKGKVIIRGKFAPIVGAVCMDLTMVDVTNIPEVQVRDKVILIGKDGKKEITAEDVARTAGTVNYEITTRISPRVPKVYFRDHKLWKVKSLLGDKEV